MVPANIPAKSHPFPATTSSATIWMFPKIGVPQNGWVENPIKMYDLGAKLPRLVGENSWEQKAAIYQEKAMEFLYVLGSTLPLFPYNRGWEKSTQ